MNETQNPFQPFFSAAEEHGRRWRLILGQTQEEQVQETQPGEGDGQGDEQQSQNDLSEQDRAMDDALEALYGDSTDGDLSDSNPDIARWLGDIRSYFPASVVQVMQQDALNKLNLRRLLNQPEFLEAIEPDVQLVANLLSLRRVMPSKTKETAKEVVRKVVEQLLEQLTYPLEQAISGSLNRAIRTRRPRHKEINWQRTVHTNLKHYQVDQKTVVPETLVGYGRKRSALRDVIIALDSSGSMATSVVYGSIYASVMASIPALATKLVMFDTKVVDLTDQLDDPVELLFGLKLGGGTNIDRALGYCQQLVSRPRDTVLVLLTDLFEGGNKANMIRRVATLVDDGVEIVTLLALNDQGAPRFDRQMAQELVNLGVPAFACTPQLFPDLMGAVLNGRDIRQWAATHNIVTAPDN
ncbi:VWA domain-containing protein [Candidatus Leptofilum sp.]|uniref:VWA domain-containing protein n=1 Tax=Candidatus Leptofilum sp. TaxID=3241576 RepID=UPI003B59D618